MTTHQKLTNQTPEQGPVSLPFDPSTLAQGIRVKPAQFARMCEVSRQTVSQWVKNGVVRLFSDGTLDPAIAARSVVEKTDPGRLRAKVFRDATLSISDWRQRTEATEKSLAAALDKIEYLESLLEEAELVEEKFSIALIEEIDRIAAASLADRPALLEELRDDCTIAAGLELGSITADDIAPCDQRERRDCPL